MPKWLLIMIYYAIDKVFTCFSYFLIYAMRFLIMIEQGEIPLQIGNN